MVGGTEWLRELKEKLLLAAAGVGPLLQRDYWAVIRDSRLRPPEVAAVVAERFACFPPGELVRFRRMDGGEGPLEPGDVLDVDIRMAGACQVGVVHRDRNSLTVATLAGHPEAGRITFGAYPNEAGDVVFHIRSRARSSTRSRLLGFRAMGDAMQTTTWTDFINRLAVEVGDGVEGVIHAEKRVVEETDEDRAVPPVPTFVATGE
ncbi:MAG TPA: DUF1990 family protein [Longimicrobiales bacterium]|nr:DUF1990 family protein [Longimicrobiales bacterium]